MVTVKSILIYLDLASRIFGGRNQDKVDQYVNDVFSKYDDDGSGELSYEGIMITNNLCFRC